MRKMLMAVALAALAMLTPTAAAAQCIVLDAVPLSRVDAGPESTSRSTDRLESQRVTIIKAGDDYYWATRENRVLFRSTSRGYDNFVDPRGGGTVKVNSRGVVQPRGSFFEHVHLGMDTITYWGLSPVYEPDCRP